MGHRNRPRRKDYWTGPLVVLLLIAAVALAVVVAVTSKGVN